MQAGGHRFEPVHLHTFHNAGGAGGEGLIAEKTGIQPWRTSPPIGGMFDVADDVGFLPGWEVCLASVLLNCESGSGASLGAPLVGCPCERAPTSPLWRKPGQGDREV